MGNNLDTELAEAAGVGQAEDDTMAVPEPSEGTPAAEPPRRNAGLLAVLLVMVAGIVALFMFGFQDAAVYSIPVDKLLAERGELVGRRLRIDGELVVGTLKKRDEPCEYRFRVHGKSKRGDMEVRYPQCIIPDTFRDMPEGGVLVTAEGVLKETHFEANLIMAKCSSKYDPKTHKMKGGEQASR